MKGLLARYAVETNESSYDKMVSNDSSSVCITRTGTASYVKSC